MENFEKEVEKKMKEVQAMVWVDYILSGESDRMKHPVMDERKYDLYQSVVTAAVNMGQRRGLRVEATHLDDTKRCLGVLVKIILWVVVIGWVISWFV